MAGVWGGVAALAGRGEERCGWVLARRCEESLRLGFQPPEKPRVVVDLSLWHEHTPGEKHELVEQILAALNVVRGVLWDGLWSSTRRGIASLRRRWRTATTSL
jgi:tRNA (adenine9-N1/guanine9-N1)-methyltransferase